MCNCNQLSTILSDWDDHDDYPDMGTLEQLAGMHRCYLGKCRSCGQKWELVRSAVRFAHSTEGQGEQWQKIYVDVGTWFAERKPQEEAAITRLHALPEILRESPDDTFSIDELTMSLTVYHPFEQRSLFGKVKTGIELYTVYIDIQGRYYYIRNGQRVSEAVNGSFRV